MVDVHSKAIRSISHSKHTEELYVHMHDGTNLVYYDVPRSEYHNFKNAASVGSYFNQWIRNVYAVDFLG